MPMGDASRPVETWSSYLRRMTDRPGWSVARLARESGINRATIFKWISGARGVTVANVAAIARALDDDPTTALRAAAAVEIEPPRDETIELIRTDPRLTDEQKIQAINLVMDQRRAAQEAEVEQARRIIEMMGDRG